MLSALKTVALLAGGVAALEAARRFNKRVPRDRTVVIFEPIGRVPGRKRDKVMIGYPIHATSGPIDEVAPTKQVKKEINKGVREADAWLGKSTREDGKRHANKTLGGNRNAICEFVLVKRSRKAKSRVIGVTKRCFTVAGGPEVAPLPEPGANFPQDFDPTMGALSIATEE